MRNGFHSSRDRSETKENCVYVKGNRYWGLGNILFQVATALHYHIHYGFRVILNEDCPYIQYGNKDPKSSKNYRSTIFAKFEFGPLPPPEQRITVHNDYTCHPEVPTSASATHLCIQGYCQNFAWFHSILPHLPDYFDWSDPKIGAYLDEKYAHIDWSLPSVLVGLRIRDDFRHMTKIQSYSYERALHHMVAKMKGSSASASYNLIIVSDTPVGIDAMLNFPLPGTPCVVEYIDETDMVQMHLGLRCDHFILCESTFHYWIAVFRQALHPTRTRVVCFEDTDMTLRPLALPEWERIPYGVDKEIKYKN